MPSDESKGSQLDAIGSLAQRQLDNTVWSHPVSAKRSPSYTMEKGDPLFCLAVRMCYPSITQ